MKITLESILTGYQSLQELQRQPLPIVAAFNLNKLEDFLKKENANFAKIYKEFVNKYGEKDESGKVRFDENQNPIFRNDNIEERNKEYFELITSEVEIPNIKIPLKYLEKAEISSQQLKPLMPFLTE